MRTDVKVGVVFSLVVGLIGGVYYLSRDKSLEPIPLSQSQVAGVDTTTSGADVSKPAGLAPTRKSQAAKSDGTSKKSDRHNQRRTAGHPSTKPRRAGNDKSDHQAQPKPTASGQETKIARQSGSKAPGSGVLGSLVDKSDRAAAAKPRAGRDDKQPVAKAPATSLVAKIACDTHRAQRGDTFASLALAYYGNERFAPLLIDANPQITDPAVLQIGTAIAIPPLPEQNPKLSNKAKKTKTASSKRPESPKVMRTYVVKRGDTFYGIARDELGNPLRWRELLALNKKIVDGEPKNLRPGQVLTLPIGK